MQVFMGESRNKKKGAKYRDDNGYPLRGYDVCGPPPRKRSFKNYMKDEKFLKSLPPPPSERERDRHTYIHIPSSSSGARINV